MAIQLAAEICVHKGFTNVVIETDSTIARLIMIQEVSAPWAVDTIVRKIIAFVCKVKAKMHLCLGPGDAHDRSRKFLFFDFAFATATVKWLPLYKTPSHQKKD